MIKTFLNIVLIKFFKKRSPPPGKINGLGLLGNKWCNCSNKINICEIFILFWINTFSIWTVTLFVLHFLKILNIYYYITLKSCNGSNKINILQIFILFWINTFSIWTVTILRKKTTCGLMMLDRFFLPPAHKCVFLGFFK